MYERNPEHTLVKKKLGDIMAGLIVEVNDSNFSEILSKSKIPVLVDFWAPWCGPCLALNPTITQLSEIFKDKVQFAKMNVDENSIVPAEYGVRSIPSLFLIKDSQVVDSLVGSHSKEKISSFIQAAL